MPECKTITFRPTPEFERQIGELMDRWGCKRTPAILRAVASAAQHDDEHTNSTSPLQQDAESIIEAAKGSIDRKPNPIWQTGRVDPEKIAAFQRKVGMDIFDAKKRRK